MNVKERGNKQGWLAAPERLHFLDVLQRQIQFFGNGLQRRAARTPKFAVEPDEKLEKVETKNPEEQPSQDCDRLVPRAVGQVTWVRFFLEHRRAAWLV